MLLRDTSLHDAEPAPGCPNRDQRIRAEQARLIWRSPLPQLANAVSAAFVFGVTWHLTGHAELIVWVAVMTAVVLLRFRLWHHYRRSPATPESAQDWLRRHTLCSGVAACLWGICAWLVFHVDSFTVHVFVTVVIAGMGAGAVAASSAHLPALAAYLLPSSIPLAVAFLAKGDVVHVALAVLTLLFIGLLWSIGRHLNRSLLESFGLQIDNAELVEKLERAGRQLETRVTARTAQLSKEIDHHKRTEQALRQSQEALIASKEQAEMANRAKSEFLANMSHELRTPLNAVIGFAEVIQNEISGDAASAKHRDYAKEIHDSGQHLLALINDILDLSKIEAGHTDLDEEPVDVHELIRSSMVMVNERAQAGGVMIEQHLPGVLPKIHADERKLRQVLLNLLSNAIKFTPSGGSVSIEVRCSPADGWAVVVSDTGIGIAPEDIPKVTERFVQLEEQLTRRYEGTGLGLALSKSLLELHGGSLDLQSEVGVGTTVTAHLPAGRIIGSPAAQAGFANAPGPSGEAAIGGR